MPETIFNENLAKLQNVYSILIKGDAEPGKEAEFRVEIIDIISNLEAAIISVKSSNEEFIVLLAKLRENILSWNGAVFRQQVAIIDLFNELFFKAKSVVFTSVIKESDQPDTNLNSVEEGNSQPEATNLIIETDENDRSEATRLKKELASMKSELGDLKELISSLMKEKKKQNGVAPQQPVVEERPQEIIAPIATEDSKSQLPWKREPKLETSIPEPPVITPEVAEEPPILLPIVSEDKPKEEIQLPPVVEDEPTPDEAAFEASATIQKLSQTSKPYAKPAHVIDQMKSIITEAEEETRKEISAFKDRLEEEAKPPIAPTEDYRKEVEKITPPIIEAPIAEERQSAVARELDTPIIPPTEPVVEEVSEEPDADPYMQLLTLEAEKYRLEKEIEKNETDFQEGLKNKQEFDENISKINNDLANVRNHIDLLRQQLIS